MNTPQTETPTQAWSRRAAHAGEVDFTMMYVAHDAFNRDLVRLLAAARAGQGFSPAALATWQLFSRQLHTHHTAEDTALWPRLRAAVEVEEERSLLDEMEAEHGELDPRLERIEAALADRHADRLVTELEGLAARVGRPHAPRGGRGAAARRAPPRRGRVEGFRRRDP